jgi:hypothetical protein
MSTIPFLDCFIFPHVVYIDWELTLILTFDKITIVCLFLRVDVIP